MKKKKCKKKAKIKGCFEMPKPEVIPQSAFIEILRTFHFLSLETTASYPSHKQGKIIFDIKLTAVKQ